jgi:nucleotide-binding universal stress UspA family protein
MIVMYRHILIPLENSPTDETILAHIRLLARELSSRLTLIHVADGFQARNQKYFGESDEMRRDRAYLDERVGELRGDGLEVTAILACGNPAAEILAAVEREECDLIAMGTHGHRGLADLVLGSVANAVRHQSRVPVLLVRA